MDNGITFQYGHNSGYAQTIIGTKCRAFGLNPITVNIHLNALGLKIKLGVCIFLMHHIQV